MPVPAGLSEFIEETSQPVERSGPTVSNVFRAVENFLLTAQLLFDFYTSFQ
jgi:hypothetical protein